MGQSVAGSMSFGGDLQSARYLPSRPHLCSSESAECKITVITALLSVFIVWGLSLTIGDHHREASERQPSVILAKSLVMCPKSSFSKACSKLAFSRNPLIKWPLEKFRRCTSSCSSKLCCDSGIWKASGVFRRCFGSLGDIVPCAQPWPAALEAPHDHGVLVQGSRSAQGSQPEGTQRDPQTATPSQLGCSPQAMLQGESGPPGLFSITGQTAAADKRGLQDR